MSNVNYGPFDGEDADEDADASRLAHSDTSADVGSFFKRGREYESVYVNHRYTGEELKVLASYETLNYLPPDSKVFRYENENIICRRSLQNLI